LPKPWNNEVLEYWNDDKCGIVYDPQPATRNI